MRRVVRKANNDDVAGDTSAVLWLTNGFLSLFVFLYSLTTIPQQ